MTPDSGPESLELSIPHLYWFWIPRTAGKGDSMDTDALTDEEVRDILNALDDLRKRRFTAVKSLEQLNVLLRELKR